MRDRKKVSRKLNFTDNLYRWGLSGFRWPCEYITDFTLIFSFIFLALVHRKTDQNGLRAFWLDTDIFEGTTFHSIRISKEIVGILAWAFSDVQFQWFSPVLPNESFGSWIVDFKQVSSLNNMLNYRFERLFLLQYLFQEEDLVLFGDLGVFVSFLPFKNWHSGFFKLNSSCKLFISHYSLIKNKCYQITRINTEKKGENCDFKRFFNKKYRISNLSGTDGTQKSLKKMERGKSLRSFNFVFFH